MNDLLAARSVYESGDADHAMYLMRERLRRHQNDGAAWELLGLVQYSRRRFRVSVSALERSALLVPLKPSGRVCLAHGYARIGRVHRAKDLLVDLIDDRSLSLSLLLQVASGLDAIGYPCYAMNACREAVNRDPDFAQAWYDQGYYAARCGHPPSRTEALARKAISLDPGRVNYRVGLASLLMKQDRCAEACELVRHFTNQQICQVCCGNCLRKVLELYQSAHDYRRMVLCHQRLLQLDLERTSSDHPE